MLDQLIGADASEKIDAGEGNKIEQNNIYLLHICDSIRSKLVFFFYSR